MDVCVDDYVDDYVDVCVDAYVDDYLDVYVVVVAVVSSSHQLPSLGVSLFRSALSITILLSVWSVSKGSRKCEGVIFYFYALMHF